MMQQQMAAYASSTISTELIQKYLDENKQLILAILDNQNLGKLNECATMHEDVGQYDEGPLWCLGRACRYQAKLQQNLMYLAAIADAQPQAVHSLPQAVSAPSMQPAQQYLQQQQPMMSQKTAIPQYLQQSQQVSAHLSQHSYHSQQGMVSAPGSAGMHVMSNDASTGAGNGTQSIGGLSEYGKLPGSRDGNQTISGGGGGVAGSSPLSHPGRDGGSVHGGNESEVSYLKGSEDDGQ